MPIGSHHELSKLTLGSDRSQASKIWSSREPAAWRMPPGPAMFTSKIAHSAAPALVEKTFVPSITYPPDTFLTCVPKRAASPGARDCGSPLQATHLCPFRTTLPNQDAFCSSVAMPSSSTSELACPSQQRAKERSAFANSLVIIHSVKTSPL